MPPPHGPAPPGRGRTSSRRLWDDARDPDAPPSALLRAVLYELQPVRYSSVRSFLRERDYEASLRRCFSLLRSGVVAATALLRDAWVWGLRWVWTVARSSSWTDAVFVAAVVGYCYLVRYLHRLLDAGPFVVLVSATALIWTIGLDDGEGNANRGGRMSAYSVFNRRCRSIMGSIDVEGLVNQYVGGNLGFAAGNRDRLRREEDVGGHDDVGREPGEIHGDDRNDNGDGAAAGGGRSRKSGKKARRRNLEERRDRRRQREAAAAMGFMGDGGEAEAMAMNRLVEEEAAAAAAAVEEDNFGIELHEAGFDG